MTRGARDPDAMFNVERTLLFADLKRQTESYWWAASSLRDGPHSGAYWVLRALLKTGKSQLLKYRAYKALDDLGYADHAARADW